MQKTTMSDSWYEVLSVLHLMAVLSLSKANLLLLPRTSADGYQSKALEELEKHVKYKKVPCQGLLKFPNFELEFAVQKVLPQLPLELRNDLPLDLREGVLKALCLQALGQAVDFLYFLFHFISFFFPSFLINEVEVSSSITHLMQAQQYIMDIPLANGWGEKHKLFIQWKHDEAKAVAYYRHGLILEEGNTERSAEIAAAALQAAEGYLKESKKACESFHMTPPSSW
ncbi:hypothetical protein COLO4_24077 [Corchorus olitorius]|uniref:Endosomal targeting BRO1-like domain-containing protein n=1 Tax=Corchorus olitorius TaxID=93759 RepID=A0A1R3ID31_9ROSI|nr:hypothetical protein COLO4_24077 [Corchorus olitorius]